MHCPYCNHKISAHANFCEQCGKKIPKCPTCGHIILKRENFCPVDGTPFPPEFFADWPMEETALAKDDSKKNVREPKKGANTTEDKLSDSGNNVGKSNGGKPKDRANNSSGAEQLELF